MTAPSHREDKGEALQRQAFDWLSALSLDGASEQDIAALREWRGRSAAHAAAFSAAARTWRSLDPVLRAARGDERIEAAARRSRPAMFGRRAMLGGMLGASAAVAGVMVLRPPLGLWPSVSALRADYRTGTGQQRKLSIGRTASVELNTETSIDLRPEAKGEAGIELISGEAAVTKTGDMATAFVVIAGNGRAVAREAVFNIRRDGAAVCVTCISGQVQVTRDGRLLSIGASQQVSYDAAEVAAPVSVDANAVAAWRDGMLVFHDTPITQVIAEVNRYRPGRIVLLNAALGQRLVTARFELGQLDDVVTQMNQVFGARVTALPGGIVLLG